MWNEWHQRDSRVCLYVSCFPWRWSVAVTVTQILQISLSIHILDWSFRQDKSWCGILLYIIWWYDIVSTNNIRWKSPVFPWNDPVFRSRKNHLYLCSDSTKTTCRISRQKICVDVHFCPSVLLGQNSLVLYVTCSQIYEELMPYLARITDTMYKQRATIFVS